MPTINKIHNCPPLRFPDFTDEWTQTTLGEILSIGSGRDYKHLSRGGIPVFGTGGYMTSVDQFLMNGESVFIGRKGTIDKPFYYNGKFWTVDTLFYTHSFVNSYPRFVLYLFSNINWLEYNEASGVPSLSKTTISKIPIYLPSLAEQKKIADFLSLIDERVQSCSETIKELKTQKAGLLNQLFSQKLRFPDFNDEWTQTTLGEILDYEQPTLYIVNNTDYSNDSSLIPVLTANKSFVLGYVNEENIYDKGECIILDDFTLDIKFVDFPFKVKSSAIKILTAKKSVNIKTIYNYLLFMNLRGQEKDHKRHYISEIQPLSISLPSLEEQKKIADFLSLIDERIEVEEQLLKQYEKQRRYLLRKMFV